MILLYHESFICASYLFYTVLVAKAKKAAKAQAEKELLKAISICFSLLSIDLLL